MPRLPTALSGTPRLTGLSFVQRCGLAVLVTAFLLFGVVTEWRSAFLTHHRTDLQVYLRAAWAVRANADLYKVTDDNNWHYHYPPLFAILMTPLADAPPGAAPLIAVPFPVSVALWYVLSVGFLVAGVHWLAQALEDTSPGFAARTPPGCRAWWALRVLPIVACLPPVWGALARGQVNLLLVALLCGMGAAILRGRRTQAGLWLAGAICLKVFPAFLLIYPLWRRDLRCLAGCAAGLAIGLGAIPAAVFGPSQTLAYYQEWTNVLVRPGLGQGEDHTRDKELITTTATDSQSFVCVLHNTLHLNRMTRPREAAPETRLTHWVVGGVFTGLTLLALGWRRRGGRQELLGLGTLTLIMFLLSPVCHLHYFCLALPLVMGFLTIAWESPPREGAGTQWRSLWLWLILGANGVANTLPHLPDSELLRDLGLATYGTLVLWLAAVVILCWNRRTDVGEEKGEKGSPIGGTCQVAA
jgi:hypothetical protein